MLKSLSLTLYADSDRLNAADFFHSASDLVMKVPAPLLALLLCCLLAVAACDDDPQPSDAPDASASDADDATDTSADASDASDELFREATVEVGGTSVTIAFEPFRLEVGDGTGELLTSTPDQPETAFSGVDLAVADNFRRTRYYDPKLQDEDGLGEGLTWYRVDELLESVHTQDGARFVASTFSPDGAAGPQVSIELAEGPHSVVLTVTAPDDEELVHTALSLAAHDGEGFYGLGEHFDKLDGRGQIREMQVQAVGASESGINEVHVPIPFYLSTQGYGFFVEDRHPAAFDLGHSRDDVVRTTFSSRSLRYHFLVDDDPMALIETYTDIMGKPAHVPFWALGPMWWRNHNEDQAEVIEDAERGRAMDIPSTVMWIDRPWQSYYHNWRFSEVQFPDPEAMFDRLHELGHRVILHHSPQMNPRGASSGLVGPVDESEGLYEMYDDNGWLVTLESGQPVVLPWGGGDGGFVDFSHPDAVDHVQQTLRRVADLGVVGTKMDWDEYLQPNLRDSRIPMVFANGETNMTMKGWYSALYHKAIIEGFDDAIGEPTFHISRSGAPGDQVWNTCIWPGDLDSDFTEHTRGPSDRQRQWNVGGMPAAIVANQSLGMVGYPCFGSDIGGYREGPASPEVMQRWLAFGTFNTVMQLGGGGSTHMAWSSDAIYDAEVLETTRKYFKLRMELFPYIFHYLLEAERTGRPVVRSLWLAYPDVAQAREHERDFLFGPDMLIAPIVTEGATARELYLPPGGWVDFWTGEHVAGDTLVTRDAPIDLIPIYLREGAIIPMADPDIDTLVEASDPQVTSYADISHTRVLLVPSEQQESVSLFNGLEIVSSTASDDVVVQLEQQTPPPDIDARVAFAPDLITLHVHVGTPPSTVTLDRDGTSTDIGEGTDCRPCWSFDDQRNLLDVRLEGAGTVTIRPGD